MRGRKTGRKSGWTFLWLVPCVILAVAVGCKRQYPSRPASLAAYTATPLISHTFTVSAPPTLSPTRTRTATLTPTPTGMATSTFTLSPTHTLTLTATWTYTPSNTPTPTNTPLPPVGVDDLEDGNLVCNTLPDFNVTSAGSWYVGSDGSCSPALSVVAGGANASNYAVQATGSACVTYADMGFWFRDDITGDAYTVDIHSKSTGVRFDIRQVTGTVSSVRFEYLGDRSANGVPYNTCGTACRPGYGKDLIIASSWQSVTIFWDECTLPSWYVGSGSVTVNDAWNMYGLHWIANANGNDFGFQLDNVALVNDTPPPTPTPNCSSVDNMEDNDNRGVIYGAGDCGSDGVIGLHSGYWYTYQDALGGVIWPSTTDKFYMSAPGSSSGYAARITGTNSVEGGDIYAGMGMNLVEPKVFYDLTIGGKYSGIQFDAKVGASSPASIRFKIPDISSDPAGGYCSAKCYDDYGMDMVLTTDWVTYTLPFSSLTQVGFGDPLATAFTPSQTTALQWQFLEPNVDFDLWVDNVILY